MKILFLSAASSVHTVRWVNALTERGHEVVLVSLPNHKNKSELISENIKIKYLSVGGGKGYYFCAYELNRLFKKEKPDIINAHYASGYGTLARMAKLPNVILNVWGSDVFDFPYHNRMKESILRKNLKHARQIVSTSFVMAEQTQKFLEKSTKIEITPFGVNVDKFKPFSKEKSDKEIVFGTVKLLEEGYRIEVMIEAFDILLKKIGKNSGESMRLEIYGDGSEREKLEKLVAEKDLMQYISFHGYIKNDDVPKVINNMDIFLLASKHESFGVAAIEAMACGIPVIATRVGGFLEVLEEGKTGLLVQEGNAEHMAEAMYRLSQEEELRRVMGINGRERVLKLYDWDKNVDKMLNIYNNMYRIKHESVDTVGS